MQWVAVQDARFHQPRPDPATTLSAFLAGYVIHVGYETTCDLHYRGRSVVHFAHATQVGRSRGF
jgi:hypothetical protein